MAKNDQYANYDIPQPLLARALHQLAEGVLITTSDLDEPGPTIIYANPAFERITDYSAEEIIGHNPRFLQGEETDPELLKRLRSEIERGEVFEGATINYRRDGVPFYMKWSITPVLDDSGNITHYVAVQSDVTQRMIQHQLLERQASYDQLTGLYNRHYGEKILRKYWQRALLRPYPISFMLLDLDGFKAVNDQKGHRIGDDCLQQLAETLESHKRQSDTLIRWGGDEFVLVAENCSAAKAGQIAERLVISVRQTFSDLMPLSISIGVATWHPKRPNMESQQLIEEADQALYKAKQQGGGQAVCYQ